MRSVFLCVQKKVITIDPATAKIVAQVAINVLKDRETRKRVLILILSPVIAIVLILTMAFYILTNPIEALIGVFHNETDIAYARMLQEQYGYIGDGAVIDITGDYVANEVPLFMQWDKRWGNYAYGRSGTIGSSGCGPTSLAMVIVALTGNQSVNPKVVADWSAANGYRVEGVGTSWGVFPAGASKWGGHCQELSVSAAQISQNLREGKILIASMGVGHFTKNGHFIVLRGITDGGKILVNDPNSRDISKKEWDISILVTEAKAAWAFWK